MAPVATPSSRLPEMMPSPPPHEHPRSFSAPASPSIPRPATPWPRKTASSATSSLFSSSSLELSSHLPSAVFCHSPPRCRPLSGFEICSAPHSHSPVRPVSPAPGVKVCDFRSSPSSNALCAPDGAFLASVRKEARSAQSLLVGSVQVNGSSNGGMVPSAEGCGPPCFLEHSSCPVGPHPKSTEPPSGVPIIPSPPVPDSGIGCLMESAQNPSRLASEQNTLPDSKHCHSPSLPAAPTQCHGVHGTNSGCGSSIPVNLDSGSNGVSWASVVERRAGGGKSAIKFFPPSPSDMANLILSPLPK